MSNEKNEIMATEASTYLTDPVNLNELFSEAHQDPCRWWHQL